MKNFWNSYLRHLWQNSWRKIWRNSLKNLREVLDGIPEKICMRVLGGISKPFEKFLEKIFIEIPDAILAECFKVILGGFFLS